MKVIIIKESSKIGRKNDVKDFPDGYVRNFLIPQGIAIIATPEALRDLEKHKSQIVIEKKVQEELLNKSMSELKDVLLVIRRKANEHGHLFSSIHEKEISDELQKKFRIEIEPDTIVLTSPIKETGKRKITVRVGEKESHFNLDVIAQ